MGIVDTGRSHNHYLRRPRPSDIMIEHMGDSSQLFLQHGVTSRGAFCLPPSPASTPTLQHSPKKHKTARRGVSFGAVKTLALIEKSSEMTKDEKDSRWFQQKELDHIKVSARHLCVQQSKGFEISPEDSTRGMDVYFPSRQRNHKKFIEHVLEAYHFRCAGDQEHVRQLVERWSAKSRNRASIRAQQDFLEAYPL